MKQTFLFLSLFPFYLLAQTEAGTKIIGGYGAIGYNNIKSIPWDDSYIRVNPSCGLFVKKNFLVGTSLNSSVLYSHDNWTGIKTFTRNYSIGFSPFIRYYIGKSSILKFFAGASASDSYYIYEGKINDKWSKSSQWIFDSNLSLGLVYFVTPSVGLETALNIDYKNFTRNHGSINNTLQAGLQIYLSKKTAKDSSFLVSAGKCFFIGGNAAIRYQNNPSGLQVFSLQTTVFIGKFIKENLALGISFPESVAYFSDSKLRPIPYQPVISFFSTGAGVFIRKYTGLSRSKMFVGFASEGIYSNSPFNPLFEINSDISVGTNYFITKNLVLEVECKYTKTPIIMGHSKDIHYGLQPGTNNILLSGGLIFFFSKS